MIMIIIIVWIIVFMKPQKESGAMKVSTRKTTLHIDDFLDLLNLATQLGDQKWQKEILRKLEYMQVDLQKS
ncbi:hypothetical protein D1872_245280 [compost metagenome]